jgi:hypothetical protein
MTCCNFYVSAALAPQAQMASSATFLIGSYAARPSFGAYLELKSAVDLHTQIAPGRAVFALLPASKGEPICDLGLGDAVIPLHCDWGDAGALGSQGGLVELPQAYAAAPLIHLYGGGFINEWWGRPLRLAIEALVPRLLPANGKERPRLVVSGQQVAASQEVRSWRPILEMADYLGTRDAESLAVFRAIGGSDRHRAQLSGDDALPALAAALQSPAEPPTISAHISLADRSTVSPERRLSRMARALAAAAGHFDVGVTCDLLTASTAPGGDGKGEADEESARRLADAYSRLAGEGAAPPLVFRVRNLLEEAMGSNLQLGGALLLTCSYHVALAGLIARRPTVLLVENDDYRQKAAGLSETFGEYFVAARAHEDLDAAVTSLIKTNAIRVVSDVATHRMWIQHTQKALALSRICAAMETSAVHERLDLVNSAFRDTAGQLGELRKRLMLEARLAREHAGSTPIQVLISPEKSGRYLTSSYWKRRRQSWIKSVRKRLDKIAPP